MSGEGLEVRQREVWFHSGGERIAGDLHLPDTDGPHPGIVLCNGFGGIKSLVLPEIADYFAARGFATLRFDHRGFGLSGGTKWLLLPREQVEDIRSGLTFLGAQPEVDGARLGLYGTSFGGANAIVAAAEDSRAQVVVACVPVGNGRRWMQSLRRNWEWIEFQREVEEARVRRVLTGEHVWVDSDVIMPPDPESHQWHREVIEMFPERRYQLSLQTAEEIFEFKPDEAVHLIQPRPVLFIGVEDDNLVPTEQVTTLHRVAGQPKDLLLLKGITHHAVYSGEPFRTVMSVAGSWFSTHLG